MGMWLYLTCNYGAPAAAREAIVQFFQVQKYLNACLVYDDNAN